MTAEDKRSVVTALLALIVMESLYRKGGPSHAAVMDGGTSFRSPKTVSIYVGRTRTGRNSF
jgi:hypothetical protein